MEGTEKTDSPELAQVRENHAHDMAVITEVLNREAEERDWCDDYDHVVAEINSKLKGGVMLGDRPAEYNILVEGTVSFRFQRSVTVTGPANLTPNDPAIREKVVATLRAHGPISLARTIQGAPDVQITGVDWG